MVCISFTQALGGNRLSLSTFDVGFSLPMFIGTVWVLTRKQGNHASNWKRLSIAIILLVLSTTVSSFADTRGPISLPNNPCLFFKHVVVDIVRIDEGLVKFRNTFPGGPVAFFEDIAQHTFVIKNALFTLQTLLGDAVVVGRDSHTNNLY